MNCAVQLNNYPRDLFSDSFIKHITETKVLFKKYEEYIDKPMVNCCVLGNTSTGKSTLINTLLEKDILYEGEPEGTLCVAKCYSSSNNEEYFEIYSENVSSNKPLPIKEIKNINKTNEHYLSISMDLKNSLDIYLNAPNHWILQNFSLIDCPGFNVNNLDQIIKYCKSAHIIIFCFKAKASVTDIDIEKINKIKNKIGKFQIGFIINRCDEYDKCEKCKECKKCEKCKKCEECEKCKECKKCEECEKCKECKKCEKCEECKECKKFDSIDRSRIIDKLSPLLTGKDAIYFISAREERTGMLNNERHTEFEKFKKCLQDQKSIAAITFRTVYGDLLRSATELLDRLKFTSFREYRFSDEIFEELRQEIIQLINNDAKKYYKNDTIEALKEYSDKANKEISKFIIKQLINDYNLNDEIIGNYFYKRFIRNETIPKPIFSWYEFGGKNEKIKKSFVDYLIENSTIQENIEEHYREKVERFLLEIGDYKKELENIIQKISEIYF